MLNNILNAALRGGLSKVLGGAAGRGGGALGGIAGQAALTAAVGLLLRRGGAGRLLKVGGMAALGMMAYNAWKEHQAKQGAQAGVGTGAAGQQKPFASPPSEEISQDHAQALMVAMIAAAKADGHVDDNERAQIEQAMRLAEGDTVDPGLMTWLDAELKRPLDAAAVARPGLSDPELGTKLYLASVIVAGGAGAGIISPAEQGWLDALARELRLPDSLKASLQTQAAQLT